MHYFFGFMCVLALNVMGCSETADEGCASNNTRVETCDNLPCCEGLYCMTFVDGCGGGECSSLPPLCEPESECGNPSICASFEQTPVCGCDGNLYDTRCDAHRVGFDVGDVCGAELTPAGHFPCGPFYCVAGEYCAFYDNNDSGIEEKNGYRCEAIPEACDGISEEEALCQCIEPANWGCSSVAGNGVTGVFVHMENI
jgi:hypothetical protein